MSYDDLCSRCKRYLQAFTETWAHLDNEGPVCVACLISERENLLAVIEAARNEIQQARTSAAEYHKLSEIQFATQRQEIVKLKGTK